jgi:hypothetical protein
MRGKARREACREGLRCSDLRRSGALRRRRLVHNDRACTGRRRNRNRSCTQACDRCPQCTWSCNGSRRNPGARRSRRNRRRRHGSRRDRRTIDGFQHRRRPRLRSGTSSPSARCSSTARRSSIGRYRKPPWPWALESRRSRESPPNRCSSYSRHSRRRAPRRRRPPSYRRRTRPRSPSRERRARDEGPPRKVYRDREGTSTVGESESRHPIRHGRSADAIRRRRAWRRRPRTRRSPP